MRSATSVRAPVALASDAARARLSRTLTGRFWLRWHVALMLVGAFCTGFLVNAALLQVPLHAIVVRWVVALGCGYLAWFALMRLWLAYVGVRPFSRAPSLDGDGGGLGGGWSPASGGSGGGSGGNFAGAGGGSGGGGASASFEGPAAPSALPTASPGASHGGGLDLGGFDIDDGGLLIVLAAIVLALVAALGGVVVYMVHEAPQLLVDVAFGSALASGFAGTTRRVTSSLDWCGSVWRATWKPFVALAIGVVACAVAFAYAFPGARTLGEAFLLWRT